MIIFNKKKYLTLVMMLEVLKYAGKFTSVCSSR